MFRSSFEYDKEIGRLKAEMDYYLQQLTKDSYTESEEELQTNHETIANLPMADDWEIPF